MLATKTANCKLHFFVPFNFRVFSFLPVLQILIKFSNTSTWILHQLYRGFACQMLDVEANHEHTGKAVFYLPLQTSLVVRVVAVAKHTGCGQLFRFILDDVNAAKGNHAAVVGGQLSWWKQPQGCTLLCRPSRDEARCQFWQQDMA